MNCGVRPLIALTLAGALLLGGSGCGSDDDDDAEVAAAATPIAQVQNLTGVASEVILAQEFREDLQGLNIMPKPTGKATRTGNTLSFPITGGSATYYPPGTEDPHFQGSILHENSGLQLTKGATTVELTKLIFDGSEMRMFGNIVVNGRTVSEVAPLFTLNGQTFEPLQITDAGTAVLEGATVNLTPNAVRLLNKTFDISALSKDTAVGTAEIVLQLSPS